MRKLTCSALVTALLLAGTVPVYAGNGRGGGFHRPTVVVGAPVFVGPRVFVGLKVFVGPLGVL